MLNNELVKLFKEISEKIFGHVLANYCRFGHATYIRNIPLKSVVFIRRKINFSLNCQKTNLLNYHLIDSQESSSSFNSGENGRALDTCAQKTVDAIKNVYHCF